jgi:glycerol kinase
MPDFVRAVDQGTTSSRFMIFDHDGNEVGKHQLEHEQILPRAGGVEHNPLEIWERTQTVIGSALMLIRLTPLGLRRGSAGLSSHDHRAPALPSR